MKKEQAVLGFIAVAVIGFAIGRITSPGGETTAASDDGTAATDKGPTLKAEAEIGMPVGSSATMGPKAAKVTIIEFSDFQ